MDIYDSNISEHAGRDISAPDRKGRVSQELSELARAIREGVERAEGLAKSAVEAARAVGQNLILAKKKVPRGEWEAWLRDSTPLAVRTAQAYMRLADRMEALPADEAQRVADLPLREALKAIASNSDDTAISSHESEGLHETVDESIAMDSRALGALRKTSGLLAAFATQLEEGAVLSEATMRKLATALNRSLKIVEECQAVHERQQTDTA
jgi:hypothetical protein